MSIKIKAGTVFESGGNFYVALLPCGKKAVQARDLISGNISEIVVGNITTVLPAVGGTGPSLENLVHADGEPKQVWKELQKRFSILQPLMHMQGRTAADVSAAAAKLHVSQNTAYKWIRSLETTGQLTTLLRKNRADIGKPRISKAVESAIKHVIETHWTADQKKSVSAVLTELEKYCRKRKLVTPHRATLQSRIDKLTPYDAKKEREGIVPALSSRLSKGSIVNADYPYAMIQIDHTKVDLELVDSEDRSPIGRPWITVAIDVRSRMTVGWYISFDPPGALATGITIANLILPKSQQMARMGVDYEWLCQGIPAVIHADNAKEFRGNMLTMACKNYGFDLRYRKVKHPQYGAHIERLQGTLMSRIKSLEGATFSNTREKGEYKSADKAMMTLAEFETWFAHLVLGNYHTRPHGGLEDRAPVDFYREAILGSGEIPGIGLSPTPPDEERLRLDLLPPLKRTIQPDGVNISKIEYRHPVLQRWLGKNNPDMKPDSNLFVFRRDPRNIGKIFFFDPTLKIYFAIPYANKARKAMTLWRLNAIRKQLSDRGILERDINEDVIFEALDRMDEIVAGAKTATRATRREKERAKKHRDSPATNRTSYAPPLLPEDESDDDPSSFQGEIRSFDEVSD